MQRWQGEQSLEPPQPFPPGPHPQYYPQGAISNKSNSYHGEPYVPAELFNELQSEVRSLLEFKNALLETFPHLHHKITGVPNQPQRQEDVRRHLGLAKPDSTHDVSDEIPSSWNVGQTNTGSMPRLRKLRKSPEGSSTGSTVADSGFSTEKDGGGSGTSTLLSPSTGGKGPPVYPPEVRWDTWTGAMAAPPSPPPKGERNEDELMFLLDVIHWKAAKIRNEGEEQERRQLNREESRKLSERSRAGITLGAISENEGISSDNEIKASDASGDSPRRRSKEGGGSIGRNDRELLVDRISELESETIRSHTKVSKLESEINRISRQKELLEDQLRTAVTHKSELDTKIHDMHSQYVKANSGRGKEAGSAGIIHSVHILTGGVQTEPSLYSSEGNSPRTNDFRKMLSQSESNLRRVGAGVPEGAHGSVNIEIRQPDAEGLSRSSEQLVYGGRGGLPRMPKVPISHSVSVVNLKASSENLHTGRSFSDINALARLRTNSFSASTGAILRHSSKPLVLHSDHSRFFQNKMAVPPNTKVSPQLNRVLSNEKLSPKSRSVENLYEQQRLHLKPAISEMSLPQRTLITSSQAYLASPQGSRLKSTQSEQVLTRLGEKNRLDPVNRLRDSVVSMPAELAKGLRVKPNRERIRQILSTSSVLELQRQLLTTVMENEVYKSQMSRVTEGWNSKIQDFEKVNNGLQVSISQLQQENDKLRLQVEEKSIELEGTRARLRQLEKDEPSVKERRSSVAGQVASNNKQVQTDKRFQDPRQGLEELAARLGQDNYVKFGPPDSKKEEPRVTFDLGPKKTKIVEVPSAKKAVTIENIRRTPSQLPSDAKQRLQEMAGHREAAGPNTDIKRNFRKSGSVEILRPTKSTSKPSTPTPLLPTTPPASPTKNHAPAIPSQDTQAENKTNKQRSSLSRKDSRGSQSNNSAKNSILIVQNNNANKVARDTLPRSVPSVARTRTPSVERSLNQGTINSSLNMDMTKDSSKVMTSETASPPPLHLDHSLSSVELRHMERDTIAGLIAGILQKYTKKEEALDTRGTGDKTGKIDNNSFVEIALAEEDKEEENIENTGTLDTRSSDTASKIRLDSRNQRPESRFMSQRSWETYNHMEEEIHGSHAHYYELTGQRNASRMRQSPQKSPTQHQSPTHIQSDSITLPDSLNEFEGEIYQSPHLYQDSLRLLASKDRFAGLGSPDDVDSLQFCDSLPPPKEVSSPVDSLIGLQQRKDTEFYDSISSLGKQSKQTAVKRRIIPYHDHSLSSGTSAFTSQDTESFESTSPDTDRTTQIKTGDEEMVPHPYSDVTLAIHPLKTSQNPLHDIPIRPLSRRYSTTLSPPKPSPPHPDLRIEDIPQYFAVQSRQLKN